ncbi:MAG: hypothetical protein ACM3WV_11150 [Bacillota bacterium]
MLLVDDRLAEEGHRRLLPPDWFRPGREFSTSRYKEVLKEFWRIMDGMTGGIKRESTLYWRHGHYQRGLHLEGRGDGF